VCPCESAECGPVQLFETDKKLRENEKKNTRARESAENRIDIGRMEGRRRRCKKALYRIQQKLIRHRINAASLSMVFAWKEEEGRGGYACWRRIFRIVSPFVPAFAYRLFAVRSELFCHASQNKVHL